MEKRSEWSRFYLAEVSEADEIPYNGHDVVDERRNLVEGVHAEIEGVCRGTIGADGEETLNPGGSWAEGDLNVEAHIVNVVATASLSQKVDLYELGKLDEFVHNSEVYGGRVAYFRSPNLKGMVSVFASGKMISVGTKSEEEAYNALVYTKEFLVQKGFVKPNVLTHKIQNIVVSANFKMNIDLEELAENNKVIYEPEQFPGGILRIEEPYKATVLLFASGKAVVTGLLSFNEIKPVLEKTVKLARRFEFV